MEDLVLIFIYFFLVIFLPFQTLTQTTESGNDSQPHRDMHTNTSGFSTTSYTVLLGTSTTNGSHTVSETTTNTVGTGGLSIETLVFPSTGLRVWHIAGLVICGLLIIIIIICCRVDIRIPRSNQEIDDGDRRRTENKKYLKELDSATWTERKTGRNEIPNPNPEP